MIKRQVFLGDSLVADATNHSVSNCDRDQIDMSNCCRTFTGMTPLCMFSPSNATILRLPPTLSLPKSFISISIIGTATTGIYSRPMHFDVLSSFLPKTLRCFISFLVQTHLIGMILTPFLVCQQLPFFIVLILPFTLSISVLPVLLVPLPLICLLSLVSQKIMSSDSAIVSLDKSLNSFIVLSKGYLLPATALAEPDFGHVTQPFKKKPLHGWPFLVRKAAFSHSGA